MGIGDWLGTGAIASYNRRYLPFEEARNYVRSLNIKNNKQWRKISSSSRGKRKLPDNIPTCPNTVYQDKGWVNWGDWFGTMFIGKTERSYREFGLAREYARSLKLKTWSEWRNFCKSPKRPADIPAYPKNTYEGKGWISSSDWLGANIIAAQDKTYLPFKEARIYSRKLGLQSAKQWRKFCKDFRGTAKLPDSVPNCPYIVYKDLGWIDWADWLGK
jgi:hypothetical protein